LNLEELRKSIDKLDEQLVDLINQRAKIVEQVGKIKRNDKNAPPIYAPDRERAVLDKIKANNQGPLPDRCLMAIYRELMSGSFYLERPLRIAYLGPKGSFSHSAALLKFGQCVDYEPLSTIADVFKEIERKHCDMGIVPIENSISGGIVETLDALIDSTVIICAEVTIAIHHNLLANCRLEDIEVIYSKPEIFIQCRNWLNVTLPNVATISTASSAEAAQIASKKTNAAAIGSTVAAELYELSTLCENIEDFSNNITRFFVIGREPSRPSGQDKTAIMFSTAHKTGALVDVLQTFQDKGINLTNIESRPSKKRQMEYYFFVNCEGHQSEEGLKAALEEAKGHCLQLSTLGSFPASGEIL
jgi:chorismate mutase/prephenate dehydratase